MNDVLANMTVWHWVAIALVLFSIEMLVGTFDLLWMATAALIAALFTWLAPEGVNNWQSQTIVFAIAATALVVMGRTLFSGLREPAASHPDLNDRIGKMVGQKAIVTEAFAGGKGRIKFGDTQWSAECEGDAACFIGDSVEITGGSSSLLTVKKVD